MGVYNKDALFTAILSNDTEQIKRLKSQGAVLSDKVKITLSITRLINLNRDAVSEIACDYQSAVRPMNAEDFIRTIRTLREEISETLFFFPAMWTDIKKIMFEDGVWECVLDCFDHKMNKARTMRDIIKHDRADILAICAKHGWLSQPKKRDEMIDYATANGKTECIAFLLDFKNRTADLASERAKAEKIAERELNAAPDSVAALKQIWNYKKQSDGTLIITGYKGSQTKVAVPEKIGKDTVTAIGDKAFSPWALRINPEVKNIRKAITEVTLPDTVRLIEFNAFGACTELVSVNIPDGVTKIGYGTFTECHSLEKIIIPKSVRTIGSYAFGSCHSIKFVEIPDGVEEIGEYAFAYCQALTTLVLPGSLKSIGGVIVSTGYGSLVGAIVPRGSVAEVYCKKHNIPYTCKEDKD